MRRICPPLVLARFLIDAATTAHMHSHWSARQSHSRCQRALGHQQPHGVKPAMYLRDTTAGAAGSAGRAADNDQCGASARGPAAEAAAGVISPAAESGSPRSVHSDRSGEACLLAQHTPSGSMPGHMSVLQHAPARLCRMQMPVLKKPGEMADPGMCSWRRSC